MIFSVPQWVDGKILVPATHWYWQKEMLWDQWVAVDGELESEADWFGDPPSPEFPERLVYPIIEMPPSGCMIWMSETGPRRLWAGKDPLDQFVQHVARLRKQDEKGDRPAEHELLENLISEARTLVDLPQILAEGVDLTWYRRPEPQEEDQTDDDEA